MEWQEILARIYIFGFSPCAIIFLLYKQYKFKKDQKEETDEDHRRNEKTKDY